MKVVRSSIFTWGIDDPKQFREKLMEQKEMTAQDAWIAMANGEFVQTDVFVHRVDERQLQYWDRICWCDSAYLGRGPYSIVPDPSKPQVKDAAYDYTGDRSVVISRFVLSGSDEAKATTMIEFIEKHFQRKEAKS